MLDTKALANKLIHKILKELMERLVLNPKITHESGSHKPFSGFKSRCFKKKYPSPTIFQWWDTLPPSLSPNK